MSGMLPKPSNQADNMGNRKKSFTERFTRRVASTWGRMSTRPQTPEVGNESDLLTSVEAGANDPFRMSPKVPRRKKFSSDSTATIIPYHRKSRRMKAFPPGNVSQTDLTGSLPAGFVREEKGNIKHCARAGIPDEWRADPAAPPVPVIPERFATQRFRPAVGPSGTSRTTDGATSKAPFGLQEPIELKASAGSESDEDREEALRLPPNHRRTLRAGSTPGVKKHAQAVVNKPYIYRSARQATAKERLPIPDFEDDVATSGAQDAQTSRTASERSQVSEKADVIAKVDSLAELQGATGPAPASVDGHSMETSSQNSHVSVKKTGFIDKPTVVEPAEHEVGHLSIVSATMQGEDVSPQPSAGPSTENNNGTVKAAFFQPKPAASIASSSSSRTPLGTALQYPQHVHDFLGRECMWMSEPTGGYWRVTPKGMQMLDDVLAPQRSASDVSSEGSGSGSAQPEESGVIDPSIVNGIVRDAQRSTELL